MHIVSVCCIFMLYIKSRWVTALSAANTYPIKFELKYKKCRKHMLLILAQQDKKKKIWLMEKWLKAHKGSRLQIAIIEIAHKWDKSTWNPCKGPLWKVSVCTIINLQVGDCFTSLVSFSIQVGDCCKKYIVLKKKTVC